MEQPALVLKAGGNTGLGMWTGLRRGEATKPMPKTELEGQRKWGSTRPVLETEGWKVKRCAVFLGPVSDALASDYSRGAVL